MSRVVRKNRFGMAARIALIPTAALGLAILAQAGTAQPRSAPHARLAQNGTYAPAARSYDPAETAAHRALEAQIRSIGESFNGDIGIAVEDVQTGWTAAYDGDTYFPQQSVSKFWVALTALDKADRGELNLEAPFTLHKRGHHPVPPADRRPDRRQRLYDQRRRADDPRAPAERQYLQRRDPVARRRAGGGPRLPRARRGSAAFASAPASGCCRARSPASPGSRAMPTNGGFYKARDALPASARRAAFERYIASPMDGAMPLGVVDALSRLKRGELLSASSTQRLLGIMSHTKTGPQRLKGGLEPGWTLSHKTGTGQVLGGVQAGYNDIGVITGPDGHSYAMAVMIRRTSAPLQQRMRAMQNVVHAVIGYHDSLERSGDFAGYAGGSRGGRR